VASQELNELNKLPASERIAPLIALGRRAVAEPAGLVSAGLDADAVVRAFIDLVASGEGSSAERVELGEVLSSLGDPRILPANHDSYWVRLEGEEGAFAIGRFPVTNTEFRAFVDGGGYQDREAWSEEGWAWLQSCDDPWPVRASHSEGSPLLIANQPVVGVTWHEASAFALSAGARLPRFDERLWATRGDERRPYPWGMPFGTGNANTREEVLRRPCAVGLFVRDCTPEGVYDLAGNVAEWCSDGVARDRWIHPGSWQEPSMAAWAKARSPEAPDSRWAGLGFRLVRDV